MAVIPRFYFLHIILTQNPIAIIALKNPNLLLIDPRIVGGVTAKPHEFPWLVEFRYSNLGHRCGGSILNEHYVLTAGHCVDRLLEDSIQNMQVIVSAEHNTACNEGSEVFHKIVNVKINERYQRVLWFYDIAIVQVSPPFRFNRYVQPMAQPPTGFSYTDEVTVAGWGLLHHGHTDVPVTILRKVKLRRVDDTQCLQLYPSKFRPNHQICYGEGGLATTKSSCEGDSGGPVHCDIGGQYAVCGTVSSGKACGYYYVPTKFVKVTYFEEWIRENSNISSPNFEKVEGCGGHFKGARGLFDSLPLLGGEHCHWIIELDFSEVALRYRGSSLFKDDKVFITDVSLVRENYKPTIFSATQSSQLKDVSVIIVTLRISQTSPNTKRYLHFDFESRGEPANQTPLTGFRSYTGNTSAVSYPLESDYYYNSQNVMFVIAPEWRASRSTTFQFTLLRVPDAFTGVPGPVCRADHIVFLYIDVGGEFRERVRHCGNLDTPPAPFEVGIDGLVFVNFFSTPDSQFGSGFRFRYFAN